MANEHYSGFIEEAFVKPIRSVLIVDDDYPTFDEVLKVQKKRNAKREVDRKKSWYENPERIERVINRFRTSDRPLLVDIHDGTNVTVGKEQEVAAHLHQSDHLVLDYQLERSKPGDGTRAIKIVRSLMSNDHFNLVVVHTKEDLDWVFGEFRLGLLAPSVNALTGKERENAQDLIEAGEDESEGFNRLLLESVGIAQYFHSRLHAPTYLRTMAKAQHPYSAFSELCDNAEWANEDRKLVLRYALAQEEKTSRSKMNLRSSTDLFWSQGPTKWIRSDSVFIAFSNKTDDDDLLTELQKALNDWNPQPSRLFLTKLRAEMDEHGIVAQSHALGNMHALAYWYDRLLRASGSERRWYIAESIARHSEQLMSAILPGVEDFATRLIEAEVVNVDVDDICKNHFKVDLANNEKSRQAEREHNAFVCSKQREGWHLTTGHIFLMNGDHWVCLSPACDMVPSQLSDARIEIFGNRLPFIAVKMQPIGDEKKPKDIQSNRFVFLQLDGAVKGFCFNDPSGDNSAPHWHTLYAENRGEFAKESFDFKVLRTEMGSRRLMAKSYEAEVVSQLRYEYALNLMHRLGVSLTRIGLDFAS